jgi:hypothetical protein
MLQTIRALTALVVFALAASACTPFKARDADPNDGGGSSMFRALVAGTQ